MSYTKGPWHVVGSDNATPHIQHERGGDWTDIDDLSSRVCVMPAEIMNSYNAWENARLIAAAPDLLEALILASQSAGFQYMFHEARDVIEKAIAKAKGEGA